MGTIIIYKADPAKSGILGYICEDVIAGADYFN